MSNKERLRCLDKASRKRREIGHIYIQSFPIFPCQDLIL